MLVLMAGESTMRPIAALTEEQMKIDNAGIEAYSDFYLQLHPNLSKPCRNYGLYCAYSTSNGGTSSDLEQLLHKLEVFGRFNGRPMAEHRTISDSDPIDCSNSDSESDAVIMQWMHVGCMKSCSRVLRR